MEWGNRAISKCGDPASRGATGKGGRGGETEAEPRSLREKWRALTDLSGRSDQP